MHAVVSSVILYIIIYYIYISILIKQRGICLSVCPEWPAMPCMEWLPALGIQGQPLMLKMLGLVLAASEVILRPPEVVF